MRFLSLLSAFSFALCSASFLALPMAVAAPSVAAAPAGSSDSAPVPTKAADKATGKAGDGAAGEEGGAGESAGEAARGEKDGPKLPLPRFATLKSDNAYIRTGPSMDYPIRWIYKREGLPVEIVQEYDAWRKIKDPDGETGWVHKILLTGHRSAIVSAHTSVFAYEKPNMRTLVAKLDPRVIAKIKKCNEAACELEFPPYKGWVEKKFLWGVYASEILN